MAEGFNSQGAANYATYAANQCLQAAKECKNIADAAAVNASNAVTQSEEAVAIAQGAASKADTAETSSSSAVETANDAKATVEEIAANEASRVSAEQARVIAEAARAAQFAEILDAVQGAQIRILSSGEYDESGVPTITGAPGIIYFVPISGTTHNTFTEWAYINDGWEVIGTTNTTIKGIDTDTIDRIVNGETVAGDEVVKTTTLSYLWTWLTQKFAAKIHTHGASGIDDKAITQAKIADGAVGETQLETTLRNSIFQAAKVQGSEWSAQIIVNVTPGRQYLAIIREMLYVLSFTGSPSTMRIRSKDGTLIAKLERGESTTINVDGVNIAFIYYTGGTKAEFSASTNFTAYLYG